MLFGKGVCVRMAGPSQKEVYRFAGLNVEMSPQCPTLARRAAPYRVDGDVRVDIRILPPAGGVEALRDAMPHPADVDPVRADDINEYLYYGGVFYRALLHFDGMLLHASAVAYDGKAYLFSAPSGTGKSTHTREWVRALPGAFILNDDKPALRLIDGVVYACGTPFSGSSPLSANVMLPVGGVCVLERGDVNEIAPMSAAEALPWIYGQTTKQVDAPEGELLLGVLERVLGAVKVWHLKCGIGREAMECSFRAMVGKRPE